MKFADTEFNVRFKWRPTKELKQYIRKAQEYLNYNKNIGEQSPDVYNRMLNIQKELTRRN